MKRSLSQSLNIPLKKQKKVLSAKAECSNWQPEKYIDTETDETIEEKIKFLRQIVHEMIHQEMMLKFNTKLIPILKLHILHKDYF